MEIKNVKVKKTANYLVKSRLPVSDWVINPYVGCPHACRYCYARFMKRFTHHEEPWGEFVDVKICDKPINLAAIGNGGVVMSSVTDAYNPAERQFEVTRNILKQFIGSDVKLTITTKSALVTRDIDILKQIKRVEVAFSLNTLDEKFRADMDSASSVQERMDAMRELHDSGIRVALFMSPIFPEITDFRSIIDASKEFVDEYWFENLNLRGAFKADIMRYVQENYPNIYPLYETIYNRKDTSYWEVLAQMIDEYCQSLGVKYINYFYHEKIRKP